MAYYNVFENMFTITTDTSIDIFRGEILADSCRYIPLTFRVKGKEYADEFNTDKDYLDFYSAMRTSSEIPSTSQISPFDHEQFFEKIYLELKTDILHLSLSSGLSETYESACSGAAAFMQKYPQAKVHVIDTLGATTASIPLYEKAVLLRDSGAEVSEAADVLREYAKTIRVYIVVDDLKCLMHGGRISPAKARLAMALNIKPIVVFDNAGKLDLHKKALGMKKALKIVVHDIKNSVSKNATKILIAHADALKTAEEAAEMLEKETGLKTEIHWIGPVIGSHTGPGTVGFVFESDIGRTF